MADDDHCRFITRCPLFPKFKLDVVRQFWVDTYCTGEYGACARFKSASQGVKPPDGLLPNGRMIDGDDVDPTPDDMGDDGG